MHPDNIIGSISLMNFETGEEIMSLNSDDIIATTEFSAEQKPPVIISGAFKQSASLTIDNIDLSDNFKKLFAMPSLDKFTAEFDGNVPMLVQAKTHKKKRINKKWLKRYGMKVVYKKAHGKMINLTADDCYDNCCNIEGKLESLELVK